MRALKNTLEIDAIILAVLASFVALFFVFRPLSFLKFNFSADMPAVVTDLRPTESPAQEVTASQISPDGTKKVILKTMQNNDNTKNYALSVATSDSSGINEHPFFIKTLDNSESIVIPFNTWSPDNKYFFVKQNSPRGTSVLVFKATYELFADGNAYLDATDVFKQKITKYNYNEATGWASESLIIINTTKPNGTKGPSFWFEVPSKAVIQLSTEF